MSCSFEPERKGRVEFPRRGDYSSLRRFDIIMVFV